MRGQPAHYRRQRWVSSRRGAPELLGRYHRRPGPNRGCPSHKPGRITSTISWPNN